MTIKGSRITDLLHWHDDKAGDQTTPFVEMTNHRDTAALIRQLQAERDLFRRETIALAKDAARCAANVQAVSVESPSLAAAEAMGARGGPASEPERLAFEAWMRGHNWALSATWDGNTYRGCAEHGEMLCPHAIRTRMLWAAWRDRAALAQQGGHTDG